MAPSIGMRSLAAWQHDRKRRQTPILNTDADRHRKYVICGGAWAALLVQRNRRHPRRAIVRRIRMASRRIDGHSVGILARVPHIDNRILHAIDNRDTVAVN